MTSREASVISMMKPTLGQKPLLYSNKSIELRTVQNEFLSPPGVASEEWRNVDVHRRSRSIHVLPCPG